MLKSKILAYYTPFLALPDNMEKIHRIEETERRAIQVRELNEDVAQLAEMMQDMAGLVDAQQETVDNITVHVETAKVRSRSSLKIGNGW